MLYRGRCLSFAAKTCNSFTVSKRITRDKVWSHGLERYHPGVKFIVACEINLSHRPATEAAHNEIALADQ
jgi:hypothetical protein